MATPRRVKTRHAGPKIWVVRFSWNGKRVHLKSKSQQKAMYDARMANILRLGRGTKPGRILAQ